MVDFEEKISRLELELTSQREKIHFFTEINSRLEETLNRFQALMEERRNDVSQDVRELHDRIDAIEDSISSQFAGLRTEMREQHEVARQKIEDLNRWRWILLGGASVLGWLASHLSLGTLFGGK